MKPSTISSASVRQQETKVPQSFREWVKEQELMERKKAKKGATISSKGGSIVIP